MTAPALHVARPSGTRGATAETPAPHRALPGVPWRRTRVSIRWIVALVAACLTALAVLSASVVFEHNARMVLAQEIEIRLMLMARNLALASTEALLTDFPELTLHPLLKGMKVRQPELSLVLVVDRRGIVQGDPDVRRLGARHEASPRMQPLPTSQHLSRGEAMMSDGVMLVASAPVRHRNGRTIGTAYVGLQRRYIEGLLEEPRRQRGFVVVALLGAGLLISLLLMSRLMRPVTVLRAGIERIGRGDLDTPLKLRDWTEFGMLADTVNAMSAELKRAQAEMVERERLAHEMELAREIQFSLLPNRVLSHRGVVVKGSQRAATEVGGDYFDYFLLPDGRIGIAIADVAGKGLAGCLVMSMLAALLGAYREARTSPAELLAMLDERLSENLQRGTFVTMFFGILDPESGRFVFASAGHTPPLVYRGASGTVEWWRSGGIPLGAVPGGAIRKTLSNVTITLEPGDSLVQFTDGVNEALNPSQDTQFGFARVEESVLALGSAGCAELVPGLHRAVESWSGPGTPVDDETIVVVSRDAESAAHGGRVDPPAESTADIVHPGPLMTVADARSRGHHLSLAASLDGMKELDDWLRGALAQTVTGERFEHARSALYEACVNIAEHGYGFDARKRFEVWWLEDRDVEADAVQGRFVILDHGRTYRFDAWRGTDFHDSGARRRGRGFGLDIIHAAARRVAYHPGTPEGNVTILAFGDHVDEERILRHA